MPEYLAPGVFVEEVSFRSKSIEGVSTTTTGFVGPTRYGPVDDQPDILTSLADFERTYGDGSPLSFLDGEGDVADAAALEGTHTELPNDMWHAVRAFFDNGGARLYVKRVFHDLRIGDPPADGDPDERPTAGSAGVTIGRTAADAEDGIRIEARYPGALGRRRVRLTLERSQNRLSGAGATARLNGVADRDVVALQQGAGRFAFAIAVAGHAPDGTTTWSFASGQRADNGGSPVPETMADLIAGDQVCVVTLLLTDLPPGGAQGPTVSGLALDPLHTRNDTPDAVSVLFGEEPPRRGDRADLPVVIRLEAADADPAPDGIAVLAALFRASEAAGATGGAPAPLVGDAPSGGWLATRLSDPGSTAIQRSFTAELTGGMDGRLPTAADYQGAADDDSPAKTGLASLEDLEDISIVAAPGAMRGYEADPDRGDGIAQALISHSERMRYRIAVLDSGEGQSITQVRAMRGRLDSKHAALYYPWITVLDPRTQRELQLPPSGFVAGIYARNDRTRAVYKAPANEVVTGALRFETMLNRAQQEVLNPEGINCFRYFEGRGNRLWGARTISSDPEWKYVNLRRYFAYLERSIDVGTQWAVFEPNGEALWGNIRRTIEDFLFNEFQMGALLGDKPEKAYFVKCDRSTMTQNDLDNGRLVCLIGVAALRPAEFVIFRIGQWTADRKV